MGCGMRLVWELTATWTGRDGGLVMDDNAAGCCWMDAGSKMPHIVDGRDSPRSPVCWQSRRTTPTRDDWIWRD